MLFKWFLKNISEYIGSRDALNNCLKDAIDSFLANVSTIVINKYKQMVNVLLHVSIRFITNFKKMDVLSPPS